MTFVPLSPEELARRRGGSQRPRTMASALELELREQAYVVLQPPTIHWPATQFQAEPVQFFHDILGLQPWSRQVEIAEAVRDHMRVAVSSGHKVGKSNTAAALGLWFYSSFADARVIMSSTTSRQVDQILWREVRMMFARCGRCLKCKLADPRGPRPCEHSAEIQGDMHELARSGLKSQDFREIVGFTAREAEAVAGISGGNLFYILDEASGIPEVIFEAIEGNRAGGARIALFSNPTRAEGEFFDAFHSKSQFYKTFRVSSEESPNVTEGRLVIPGLATREWIEEKKLEWGEDSALYKIRVKGEHVLNQEGKILDVAAITESEQRWEDAPATGRLFLGLDPAGPGEGGDETVIAVRRGSKILRVVGWYGLTEDGIVAHVLGTLLQEKEKRETAVVVLDCLGPIGSAVHGKLKLAAEQHRTFEVYGVRASDKAVREPQIYERIRDELWANMARWMRNEGGAIPEDTKLAKDLNAPNWEGQLSGRLKATDKRALKKALGRSPDRGDAACLSVWEPMATRPSAGEPNTRDDDPDDAPEGGLDPYAGLAVWQR